MIYDGVLSELLGIEMPEMEKALRKQFGKKVKAAELNLGALHAGFAWAGEHLPKQDPYRIERMDKTRGMGATDPGKADAGTLRKDFGKSIEHNATHGSDAPETAAYELGYFFRGIELSR